jgi:dual specificity tyrosine-phosphorylation-regulated kinase 2/3/4
MKATSNSADNYGFDNDRGDYHLNFHDHIAYQYEIIDLLGKGSFGRVVKVFDHKSKKEMALKIIRNKTRFH